MKRREFISLLGGTAMAWPLAARAQQPAMPVIGFLNSQSPGGYTGSLRGFRQGLKDAGYVEGENLTVEYRWAHNELDRLPALASELVRRHVAVIATSGGTLSALAAKAATTTIPIVFNMTADPFKLGLVASLNRPGGNVTGIAMLGVELEAKRLELLRELEPTPTLIGYLVNPSNAQVGTQLEDVQNAARAFGQRLLVVRASAERELETAFATLVQERADALLVGADTFFTSEPTLFAVLTARHAIPAIYPWRSHVDAGGLMSYGASLLNAYRETGV
jgi:putative ABC transport system substrate-binding protein